MLTNRAVLKRDGAVFQLLGYDELTPDQVQKLRDACDRKLAEYVARRGGSTVDEALATLAVLCAMKSLRTSSSVASSSRCKKA